MTNIMRKLSGVIGKLVSVVVLLLLAVPALADVITHVSVSISGDDWRYSLFNDEPVGSDNWLSTFTINLNSPVAVMGSPFGWDFATDGATYVVWFNTDLDPPFPNDIAPGTSSSGFVFSVTNSTPEAGSYDLTSWDHMLNEPGPTGSGSVSVPVSVLVSATPEPAPVTLLFLGSVIYMLWLKYNK